MSIGLLMRVRLTPEAFRHGGITNALRLLLCGTAWLGGPDDLLDDDPRVALHYLVTEFLKLEPNCKCLLEASEALHVLRESSSSTRVLNTPEWLESMYAYLRAGPAVVSRGVDEYDRPLTFQVQIQDGKVEIWRLSNPSVAQVMKGICK